MKRAVLTHREAAARLDALGFHVGRSQTRLRAATRAFKIGLLYATMRPGPAIGRRTSRELDEAVDRLNEPGAGTMSEHFSFHEAACKCGGRYRNCLGAWPTRESVQRLERLRRQYYPSGLQPVSWSRCTGHNTAVGGARSSRHLKGDAIDVPHIVPAGRIVRLRQFGGIGIARSDGCASHVDCRDASTAAPVMWWYANQ